MQCFGKVSTIKYPTTTKNIQTFTWNKNTIVFWCLLSTTARTWALLAIVTLALMMVGRGSRIPCIFLNAGITKRLQVTTADTGFPETERRDECWGEDYGLRFGVGVEVWGRNSQNCGASVVDRNSVCFLMSLKQHFTSKCEFCNLFTLMLFQNSPILCFREHKREHLA